MSLSASIFRRGGPKKELLNGGVAAASEGCAVDDNDEEPLVTIQEMREVISTPRSGKDYSAAIWRPEMRAAELVKIRKGTAQANGFSFRKKPYLHIEEAIFLVDRGDLMFFVEVQGQQRLLSVQEGYDLMVACGVTMERYIVYCHLTRSGYLIMRHPSQWILEAGESPQEIWRGWASIPGDPDAPSHAPAAAVPGAVSSPSGQAAGGASSLGGQTQGGQVDLQQHRRKVYPSGHTPEPSANQEGGAPAGLVEPQQGGSMQEAASLSALDAADGEAHRRWYHAPGPEHPGLQGVPASWFEEVPRHAVVESPGDLLRRIRPRLKPLGSIPDGPHLGVPSSRSRLVFDVYKPGSKVARSKRQFPEPMYHLALCIGKPPSPQELRDAEDHGKAAGRQVPVMWASVDNTIISFFQIGRVDLLPLL